MLKTGSDDPTSMWDEKLTRNFVLEDDEEEQFEEENNSLPKLRTLFDLLIRPFTNLLHSGQSSNRLVFVPCGDLFLVPFAALVDSQDNDAFLIEKYTISVVPCIQLLDLLPVAHHEQQKRPSINAVVIGDPQNHGWQRLPGARKESETIAQLLQGRVILGAEATKEVVVKEMGDKHLMHFAGHGMADRLPNDALLHPTVSGALVLSCGEDRDPEEGLIWAADIEKMQRMPGSLVVLSGCSTGRGFKISNDGVAGLARAFLSCGASTLVVSLWAIQDHYTLELLTRFYQANCDEKRHADDDCRRQGRWKACACSLGRPYSGRSSVRLFGRVTCCLCGHACFSESKNRKNLEKKIISILFAPAGMEDAKEEIDSIVSAAKAGLYSQEQGKVYHIISLLQAK